MKTLAAVTVLLATWTGSAHAQVPRASESGVPVVRWSAEGLSVRASGVPLGNLLRELSARTGLGIGGGDGLAAPAWVDFENLPLAEGLRIVLRDVNFVMRVGDGDTPSQAIVLIAPPGGGDLPTRVVHWRERTGDSESDGAGDDGWEPAEDLADPGIDDSVPPVAAPPEDNEVKAFEDSGTLESGDFATIAAALQSDNPVVRQRVVERLAIEDPARAVPVLGDVLTDPDPAVRNAALTTIGRMAGPEAASRLGQMLRDPSPGVREGAVRAASLRQDADRIEIIRSAMTDADPGVRAAAAMLYQQVRPGK